MCTAMSMKLTQIIQQSSYHVRGLFNWFKITKFNYVLRYFSASFFATVSMIMYVACFRKISFIAYFGLIFYVTLCIIFLFSHKSREIDKIPLKFTPRILRYCIVQFILNGGIAFVLLYFGMKTWLLYSLIGVAPFCVIFTALITHYLLLPFEKINNRRYYNLAQKKIANADVIKIGITGSYGKTTTKQILAKILSKKYNVCYSPSSYNTPMGLSSVINKNLSSDHQVFIAEMGARNKGDISELCKLIKPSYAMITAIGTQHYETFGSQENIIKTKYELIENLAPNGFAVFNVDNEHVNKMFSISTCDKTSSGSVDVGADVYYHNVTVSTNGTSFVIDVDGDKINVNTVLIGKHVPSLITLCVALAVKLGVDVNSISSAISELEPVEHRMQLIKSGDDFIIDDAYNANSEGANNALEILKEFDAVRIIITPGLVELGAIEKKLNFELGQKIAECVDYCCLIGTRANDIASGAKNSGMQDDKIKIFNTLDDAVKFTTEITEKKAILFENDLPDNLL